MVEATWSNATSQTILSTKSNVASTLLPLLTTMSNEISTFQPSRNKLSTFNLFRRCRKDKISRKTRSTLLPKTATMSKQHSTLSKERYSTINSFDIVAVFWQQSRMLFDKVERCFNIVVGVDGALEVF